MQKHVYFLLAIMITFIVLLTNLFRDMPVIIFFPLDENNYLTQATTNLALIDERLLTWRVQSESNLKAYLRQDVSLLYENGRLKGIQSKWKQQTSLLEQEKQVNVNQPSYLQAISFHYGELHTSKNNITSIQQMTDDYLYFDTHTAFKLPNSSQQFKFTHLLRQQMDEQMNVIKQKLLTHFQIDPKQYHAVYLTELTQFGQTSLPGYTKSETDKIIGQLWEGLYKNYLLPALEIKATDYMPIILFAKDHSHLLVIFELNKEKFMLKQLLP